MANVFEGVRIGVPHGEVKFPIKPFNLNHAVTGGQRDANGNLIFEKLSNSWVDISPIGIVSGSRPSTPHPFHVVTVRIQDHRPIVPRVMEGSFEVGAVYYPLEFIAPEVKIPWMPFLENLIAIDLNEYVINGLPFRQGGYRFQGHNLHPYRITSKGIILGNSENEYQPETVGEITIIDADWNAVKLNVRIDGIGEPPEEEDDDDDDPDV